MASEETRIALLESNYINLKKEHDSDAMELAALKAKVSKAESWGWAAFIAFGMTMAVVSQFNNFISIIKKL